MASPDHTLLLMRHAKSEWDDAEVSDHERPLSDRGQRAAALMGFFLRQRGLSPTRILCSSARRTRETLDLAVGSLPDSSVEIDRDLYLAEPALILERLRAVNDRERCVLVIGHNPGIAMLADSLARNSSPDLDRLRNKFPTGAVAELDIQSRSWADLAADSAHLAHYTTPKDLV